ncbi:MAG: ribonuclease HII [Patescibacteria group bacterium]|jgi:ribonuclease HII
MASAFASTHNENVRAQSVGAQTIAGLDEVGRGAISGPLVVGCFVRDIQKTMPRVKDSKTLSPRMRQALLPKIFSCAHAWSIGIVEADDITLHGMSWALREAFNQALDRLPSVPDIVLYDGRPQKLHHPDSYAIINGDATHATIAAASIIAKVIRDLFMDAIGEEYPEYFFNTNKGYGTPLHKKALLAHGSIKGIHREKFVKTFLA